MPIVSSKAQIVDSEDIRAVVETLQSDWLTTGPQVEAFENDFASFVGAKEAVAVNSGTAALHASMAAIDIQPGDEVVVPAITFVATANAIVYEGGTPVFVDVDVETLLIDPQKIEEKITAKTKAIVAVDYAGQPCNYDALQAIAIKHNLFLIADACHAIGGVYKGKKVGTLADLNTFSFHPVKNITTGEGGMITTDNEKFAREMRCFRNHGIETDHHQRAQKGTWYYEQKILGFNYRLTDFQCALGRVQLKKLPAWIARRQKIARQFDQAFLNSGFVKPLTKNSEIIHAYHLYVVKLNFRDYSITREQVFTMLREKGVQVNVHYLPVYLHPFYREKYGAAKRLCPVAEQVYEEILSLPVSPSMSDTDVDFVIDQLFEF